MGQQMPKTFIAPKRKLQTTYKINQEEEHTVPVA